MANKESGRMRGGRRSRAEADRIAAEYEASGLSRAAFCQNKDFSLKSLDRYIAGLRQQSSAPSTESKQQRWASVELAPSANKASTSDTGLAILLAKGRRIEVKRGFDALTLRHLLAALERA
jgi:hypothetical protein